MVTLGALAGSQVLSLLLLLPTWRRDRTLVRRLGLFAASGAVYGYEIVVGLRLWSAPADTGALTAVLDLLLGTYAIGVGAARRLASQGVVLQRAPPAPVVAEAGGRRE